MLVNISTAFTLLSIPWHGTAKMGTRTEYIRFQATNTKAKDG